MFSKLAAAPPCADTTRSEPGQQRHSGQDIFLLLDKAFPSPEAQSNAPAQHPGWLPNFKSYIVLKE